MHTLCVIHDAVMNGTEGPDWLENILNPSDLSGLLMIAAPFAATILAIICLGSADLLLSSGNLMAEAMVRNIGFGFGIFAGLDIAWLIALDQLYWFRKNRQDAAWSRRCKERAQKA